MHIITCETGTSVGAFSPRVSRRRSLAWHTHTQKHTDISVSLWLVRLSMTEEISVKY